jgi:hypothetical protein
VGATAPRTAEIVVGTTVSVVHIGIVKVGTVVKVGTTRVHVEVPIHGGEASKVIVRPISEVVVI